MTVSSTTTAVSYSGNDATTEFAVTFPFYEIEVYEWVAATGAVTAKTEGTHYTVAGGEGTTGTVTMLTAPATGATLYIRRTTAKTQAIDYGENDAFPAETHEEGLDRAVMRGQEVGQRVDFTPTFAAESGTLGATPTTFSRYSQVGDTVFFRFRITCSDVGDATGYLSATLPFEATTGVYSGVGVNTTTGALLRWRMAGTTAIRITALDGSSFPGVADDVMNVTGFYHI